MPGLLAAPVVSRAGERGPASAFLPVEQVCDHVHLARRPKISDSEQRDKEALGGPPCPAAPLEPAASASHH